jgi:hypothetical protein
MKIEFKFDNGQKVKDMVTGMTGIINGAVIWLNGCKQYSVQPKMEKGDSKKPSSWWIDEQQLVVVRGGLQDTKVKPKETGGPSTRSDR